MKQLDIPFRIVQIHDQEIDDAVKIIVFDHGLELIDIAADITDQAVDTVRKIIFPFAAIEHIKVDIFR